MDGIWQGVCSQKKIKQATSFSPGFEGPPAVAIVSCPWLAGLRQIDLRHYSSIGLVSSGRSKTNGTRCRNSSGSINLRMKGEYKVPASPGKKGKKWRPILPSEKKNRPILSLIQCLSTSISSWWWVQVEKPAENPLSSRLHLLLKDGCRALLLQRY